MSEQMPYPADLYDGCPCKRCQEPTWHRGASGLVFARMTLCPSCGNKRCPGAADHRNECSGSNEPGQAGSNYAAAPAHPASGDESECA